MFGNKLSWVDVNNGGYEKANGEVTSDELYDCSVHEKQAWQLFDDDGKPMMNDNGTYRIQIWPTTVRSPQFDCYVSTPAPKYQPKPTQVSRSDVRNDMEIKHGRTSFFDGGLFALIGWNILGFIVTIFTLGICYPWAVCMVYGWQINHTVIEGRRMKFIGSAWSLFGNWIKWIFLTIITIGIYGFWVHIKMLDWKAKNTRFIN